MMFKLTTGLRSYDDVHFQLIPKKLILFHFMSRCLRVYYMSKLDSVSFKCSLSSKHTGFQFIARRMCCFSVKSVSCIGCISCKYTRSVFIIFVHLSYATATKLSKLYKNERQKSTTVRAEK